jgi:hypothetical protein
MSSFYFLKEQETILKQVEDFLGDYYYTAEQDIDWELSELFKKEDIQPKMKALYDAIYAIQEMVEDRLLELELAVEDEEDFLEQMERAQREAA